MLDLNQNTGDILADNPEEKSEIRFSMSEIENLNNQSSVIIKNKEDYRHIDAITDWYIPKDNTSIGNSFVFPGTMFLSERKDLVPFAEKLKKHAIDAYEKDHYKYHSNSVSVDNRRFRVQLIPHINGEMFAFRRIKDSVPNLDELGVPPVVKNILLHRNLSKGGLILLVGETGQGKSTTCAAAIKSRVSEYGSFALTLEDPPELPLHGKLGKGYCIQREVPSDQFSEALKGALRSYPTTNGNILYVGEIRDSKTAQEVMKAITSGHLVFSTIHGGGIREGVERLVTYLSSSENAEDSKNNRDILAGAIRLVIHQTLITKTLSKQYKDKEPEQVIHKQLMMQILVSAGASSSVANKISNVKDIANLQDDIYLQQQMLRTKSLEEFIKTFMPNWN